MTDQETRGKFQYQREIREKNERKILEALLEPETPSLRWKDLRERTNISSPQLALHLKRMRKEGKIDRGGDGEYSVVSKDIRTILDFSLMADYSTKLTVDDPNHCVDRNGLLIFNEKDQRAAAPEVIGKLCDYFRVIVMKYLEAQEKGEEANAKLWIQHCLLYGLPNYIKLLPDAYMVGEFSILSRDGKHVGEVLGDYVGRNDVDPSLRSEIDSEVDRRYRLRRRYLIETLREAIDPNRMREYESKLESSRNQQETKPLTLEGMIKSDLKRVMGAISSAPKRRLKFEELADTLTLMYGRTEEFLEHVIREGILEKKGKYYRIGKKHMIHRNLENA